MASLRGENPTEPPNCQGAIDLLTRNPRGTPWPPELATDSLRKLASFRGILRSPTPATRVRGSGGQHDPLGNGPLTLVHPSRKGTLYERSHREAARPARG